MATSDLLVAGAGPVGMGVAIEAALAGLSVTVMDPRPGPIDKACGEGLMPSARTALARLGVEAQGREFHGIHYLTGDLDSSGTIGRGAVARFRNGPGLGVRRTELSEALARRADELGVRRVVRSSPLPQVQEHQVVCGQERATWFVAADGLHSPTRDGLGLNAFDPTRPNSEGRVVARRRPRYGLRRHYVLAPWTDLVEVYWSPDAEAYVTPVADDLVGVAVLCHGGRPYGEWLEAFPALRSRLDGARPASAVRGSGPLRQKSTRRVHPSGHVLLAGDAAGYTDALTGEGISIGLAGARELVAALVAGRPRDYERAWRRTTRRYRVLTGGLLAVTERPVLRRALVPAARRLPPVFTLIVNQLG